MQDLQLPPDMNDFFRSGRTLVVDNSELGMKYFFLKTYDELAVDDALVATYETSFPDEDPHHGEDGRYIVPVISLIKECDY